MGLFPFISRERRIVPGLAWYEQRFIDIQSRFRTELDELNARYRTKLSDLESKLEQAEEQRAHALEHLENSLRRQFEARLSDEIAHTEARIWASARETFLEPGKTFLARDERILPTLDDVFENTRMMWGQATRYGKMASLSGNPGLPWAPKAELLRDLVQRGVEIKVILLHPKAVDLLTAMEARFTEGSIWISYTEAELREMFRERLIAELRQSIPLLSEIVGIKNIRFGMRPHFWKGCITDGVRSQYVFYDIPRKSVPFRYTENPFIVKWFEDYYFDPIWEESEPMSKPEDMLALL